MTFVIRGRLVVGQDFNMKKSTKIIIAAGVVVVVLAAMILGVYLWLNRDYWESPYAYCQRPDGCPKFWCAETTCRASVIGEDGSMNLGTCAYGQPLCLPRF